MFHVKHTTYSVLAVIITLDIVSRETILKKDNEFSGFTAKMISKQGYSVVYS